MNSHLPTLLATAALLVTSITGSICIAAIPNRTRGDLFGSASYVLRGKVQRVYSTVEQTSPEWKTTFAVAEIQVAAQEKGPQLGRVAYVRFQSKEYTGPEMAPPGDYGFQTQLELNANVRVYATIGEDGGLDMASPNGIQVEK